MNILYIIYVYVKFISIHTYKTIMNAYTLVIISLYTVAIKKTLENSFLLKLSLHDLFRNRLLSLLF